MNTFTPRQFKLAAALGFGLVLGGSLANSAHAEILGPELLGNGAIESLDGWQGAAIGSSTVPRLELSTTEKHGGKASLHGTIVRGPQEWPAVRSGVSVTETGKTYRVSFWIKVVKGQASVSMRNGANSDYSSLLTNWLSEPQWTQYVAYYNERSGGSGAFLAFFATGSDAEFYLDDVSIREVDVSPQGIVKEWRKSIPEGDYALWQKSSPWAALKELQSPPTAVRECHKISVAMGRNEYESTSFVLTNLSDKEQCFDIAAINSRMPLTLRYAYWVTASNGNKVSDALPLLEGKVVVPPGESREVWLTLHSAGVAAGNYSTPIKITSPGLPPRNIELAARVYPVTLPQDKPLYTYYWDYTVPTWMKPEKARAFAADMKSHYVNVPIAHPWSTPRLQVDEAGKLVNDYKELDSALENYSRMQPKIIVFYWNRESYFEKQSWKEKSTDNAALPPYMSPAWKVLFKQYLTNWVSHMKAKGYGYDRFAMNADDETLNAPAYEMAKLIKEADPKIQVFINAFGHSLEEAQRIAPYVDIFCPFLYDHMNLPPYNSAESQKTKPLATKILKKSDKMYWTYANPMTNEPQEAAAYPVYRLAVWKTWEQGMNGFGYWVYSYKTAWNYYNNPDKPNWAVVYLADSEDAPAGLSKKEIVVPSKRWEATREGVEDYTYLSMLKNAVAKPRKGALAKDVAAGRKLLNELPTKVLANPEKESLADNGKQSILEVLSKIGSTK